MEHIYPLEVTQVVASSNWEPSGIFLLLLLQRKREGVTSPIRQVFYKYVVFGLLFLFEIIAHSLVVTSSETTASWVWGGRTCLTPNGSFHVPTVGSQIGCCCSHSRGTITEC